MTASVSSPVVGIAWVPVPTGTPCSTPAEAEALGVPYEVKNLGAPRTPDVLFSYAEAAAQRGLRAIIAGAGGAAHLPGMLALKTAVPVLGVPVQSKALNALDRLPSIVQMPAGIPYT